MQQQPDDQNSIHGVDISTRMQPPETYRVAAEFDKEAASKFSPEKDPFFSDESLYNKPVVFLEDVVRDRQRNTINDDVLSDEEAKEDYETELQEIKRKICGCFLDCDGACCNSRLRRNKCADACGCLCYKDNILEHTPMRDPGWRNHQEFDLENVGHYEKQEYLSEGFDILVDYTPVPRMTSIINRMDPISDMMDVEQDWVKKMAVLAIKRYNKMFSYSSSEYRIVNVVRANFEVCGRGSIYYITFVAAGNMGNGEPELFQGKVRECWEDRTLMRKVYLCRPKKEVFIDVNARARMKRKQKQKQKQKKKLLRVLGCEFLTDED